MLLVLPLDMFMAESELMDTNNELMVPPFQTNSPPAPTYKPSPPLMVPPDWMNFPPLTIKAASNGNVSVTPEFMVTAPAPSPTSPSIFPPPPKPFSDLRLKVPPFNWTAPLLATCQVSMLPPAANI